MAIIEERPSAGINPVQSSPAQPNQFNPMSPKKASFIKQNKWPIVVITFSILIIVVGMLIAFHKPKNNVAVQPKVTLEIEAPKESPSGSEVVYTVHVSNRDSSTMKNVVLDLVYPPGFTFISSTPSASKLNGTQFTLPEIEHSVEIPIKIKGNLQGNASETKTISSVMHYQFNNFNSDFVAQAEAQTSIVTSNVTLDFGGPNSSSAGQDLTYTVRYSNVVTDPISNFRITITVPQGFVVKSTNPTNVVANSTVFNIGTLAANQTGTVSITGSFGGDNLGDQQIFSAKAEGDAGTGQNFVLSASQYVVTITSIPLQASIDLLSGNSQTAKDVVAPGAILQFKVHYSNNGTVAAKGVNVVAKLDGTAYDLTKIQAQGATISGNQITWNGSLNSALASLQPSQSGDFIFAVVVKDPATKSNVKNLTLKATAQMTSVDFQQPFVSPEVALKIATVPQIQASVAYSSGANPPKVGQSTVYTVTVSLRNSSNEITDSNLSLNLPNISNFNGLVAGSKEQSAVSYDPTTKKVSWNVGVLTAHAGTFSPIRTLQFNITINPGPTNVNQVMVLVNNIKYIGTDSFTTQKLFTDRQDLTTQDAGADTGTIQP